MIMTPPDILKHTETWPTAAQAQFQEVRCIVYDVALASDIGPLDESLKWGQPAWRPKRPRIGSTLRVNWSPQSSTQLCAFVDCKTDLAAQMDVRFPGQFANDGRRALAFDLQTPLDHTAIWQLAHLTLTYHRAKRQG